MTIVRSLCVAILATVCLASGAVAGDAGLVGHWTFDEGRGNFTANKVRRRSRARITGARRVKGVRGRALEFNGAEGHVDCGPAAQFRLKDRATVSAWVKLNGETVKEATLAGIDPDNWSLSCVGSRVYFYLSGGGSYCTTEVPQHRWTHLAGTYDGKAMRLYVDGVEGQTRELPPGTRIPNQGRVVIGGGSKTRGSFNGAIDDVRVYNRVLSRKEIALLLQERGGERVELKGKRIRLTFSARDYHLKSFVGPEEFGDLAARIQTGGNALWRVVLMSNRGRPEKTADGNDNKRKKTQWQVSMKGLGRRFTVDAKAECRRSHKIEKTADGVRLRLFWKGLDVGEEKGVLDVTATVRIPDESDLAYWTLEMTNRSKVYGIWEYFYPIIEIAPPDPELEKNFFLNTYRMGEVVPDAFHATSLPNLYVGHNTKAGQFTALYGANGRGFFYGPRDPEGWQKRFDIKFHPELPAAQFALWSVPLNLGYAGEDFKMPFPVVAGFFKGDWYDACQIHREWALKQIWCRKGPVAQRSDIPQWLKDCPMILRLDTQGHAINAPGREGPDPREAVNRNADNFLRSMEVFGSGLGSIWYAWWMKDKSKSAAEVDFLLTTGNGNDGQMVQALKGVPEANRRVVKAGGYALAYINGVLYDMGDAADFEKAKVAAKRNFGGDIYIPRVDRQTCRMCGHAAWWQERYARLCERAIKEFGFKGVYWDSYGKDGYRCFATDHGHSYGGGPQWIQAERELGTYTRKLMKAADPEAVTSAEAPTEEFIDLVDTRLCLVIVRKNVAPIFSCIYHDYQLFYGRRIRTDVAEPEFSMTAGYSFNIGSQFGRYVIHGKRIEADNPANAERTAFLKRLIEAKRSAKEFLNLGRMLRPPKMLSDIPTLTATVRYRNEEVTLPAVLCSAWRAANGDVAVVFVNCAYDPIEFNYQIDTVEYGFPKGANITRRLRKPDGDEPLPPIQSGILKEDLTLPGHGIRIVVHKAGN